jgi:hypothetical protein
MYQSQRYNIAIFEREILLTDFTKAGAQEYVIEEKELSKLFKYDRSAKVKMFPGLIWVKASIEGNDEYLVTMKRKKRKLIYAHQQNFRHITMEIPNVAIKATVSHGMVRISNIWAYKGELNNKTQLYRIALPNVGESDVCNGENMKVGKDPMKAIEMCMFETPFNHHRHMVGKEVITFVEYAKKYKGRMPFHTLKKLGKGKSILEA